MRAEPSLAPRGINHHKLSKIGQCAAGLSLLALTSCGVARTYEARDPLNSHSFVGRNVWDMLPCLGIPPTDHRIKLTSDTVLLQWDATNSDTGTSITVLGTGVKVGGAGQCKMTLWVDRSGTVLNVNFPMSHADGVTPDSQSCGMIVAECLAHENQTQARGFDAFAVFFPEERKG